MANRREHKPESLATKRAVSQLFLTCSIDLAHHLEGGALMALDARSLTDQADQERSKVTRPTRVQTAPILLPSSPWRIHAVAGSLVASTFAAAQLHLNKTSVRLRLTRFNREGLARPDDTLRSDWLRTCAKDVDSWGIVHLHGYPLAGRQACFGWRHSERFTINGYQDEATSTTPFDMNVMNVIDLRSAVDRVHVSLPAIRLAAPSSLLLAMWAPERVFHCAYRFAHGVNAFKDSLLEHSIEPSTVASWRWNQ